MSGIVDDLGGGKCMNIHSLLVLLGLPSFTSGIFLHFTVAESTSGTVLFPRKAIRGSNFCSGQKWSKAVHVVLQNRKSIVESP